MPQEYTVKQVRKNIDKETGEQRQDNYGNLKYYVLFEGEHDNVPLSAKTEPKVGDTKYGEIVEGEYGKYFKGAKNHNATVFAGGGNNSDGQKQGMAIKAAADYVTKHSTEKLSPVLFATAVEAYATALYNLELKKAKPANPDSAWEKQRAKAQLVKQQAEQDEEAGDILSGSEPITDDVLAAIPF